MSTYRGFERTTGLPADRALRGALDQRIEPSLINAGHKCQLLVPELPME